MGGSGEAARNGARAATKWREARGRQDRRLDMPVDRDQVSKQGLPQTLVSCLYSSFRPLLHTNTGHTNTHTHVHTYRHIDMFMSIYIKIHTCMYSYMHMHIHMYT